MLQSNTPDTNPTNAELLVAIQNLATYVQVNMATKQELQELRQDLRTEFANAIDRSHMGLQQQIDRLKKQVGDFQNDVLTGQDLIVTKLDRLDQDHVATIDWLKRHDRQFEQLSFNH